MTKRELFVTAWTTARAAAARFGGSARDFFAICLCDAYAAARRPATVEVVMTVREDTRRGRCFDLAYMPVDGGYTAGLLGNAVQGYREHIYCRAFDAVTVDLPVGAFVKYVRPRGYAKVRTSVSFVSADGLRDVPFRNVQIEPGVWRTVVEGPNGSVTLAE